MSRLMAALAGAALLAGSASAQSMAEAARREKERQEKARQQGAAKVVTGDELQATPGQLANDTSIAPAAPPRGGSGGSRRVGVPGSSSASSGASGSTAPPNGGAEATWRSGIAGLRANIARLEKEVVELDGKANKLAYGVQTQGKPPQWRDANGSMRGGETPAQRLAREGSNANDQLAWEKERKEALDKLERAKAALTKTKKDLEVFEESARRQGIPPGWLR